jgi:hypothetical protein
MAIIKYLMNQLEAIEQLQVLLNQLFITIAQLNSMKECEPIIINYKDIKSLPARELSDLFEDLILLVVHYSQHFKYKVLLFEVNIGCHQLYV